MTATIFHSGDADEDNSNADNEDSSDNQDGGSVGQ
jgi:hypothetical protein